MQGRGNDATSLDALADFQRFPTWMWRNTVVLDLITWLHEYNQSLAPETTKAGFYGLDLYSLYSSIEAVVGYLDRVDPEAT